MCIAPRRIFFLSIGSGIAPRSKDVQPVMDMPPPSLDRRVLLQRVEGDLDLLVTIVEVFLLQLPRRLEKIEASLRSGDAIALAESAHTLKGSVANFSNGPVYLLSSRIEELGRSGEMNEAEATVASLRTAAAEIERSLRTLADDARSGSVLEDA